ncbi:MAG TPA: hypothetical protein VFV75_02305 [Candidatus Polarisedimenticolaceae bacterium]|nr:hypothetical protein [Candidatus Polarisedimenticolaceae bacterium]
MTLSRFLALWLLLLGGAAARAGQARVTYVSGSTVYLDAGSDAGLAIGDRVEIVRDDTVLATIELMAVTGKRASGTLPEGVDAREGDLVRFAEKAPTASPEPTSLPAPSPARRDGASLHGRVGARWLLVQDRSGLGQDFSQPSLDLRLSGRTVAPTPLELELDLRPRRTYRTRLDGTSETLASNRVYQASAAWHPGGLRVAAGRQLSPSLGPVSLFDGLLAEYRHGRTGFGAFAGSEPDPEDWGYDPSTKDYGAYLDWSTAPESRTRTWLNLGALSSTTDGEINRDVIYAAARLSRSGFHGYVLQEVDYNRGWREEAEGSTLTRSGSYAALRWQGTRSFALHAGWDSRRNVRLYRDLVTPATDFDDAYRQGIWGGAEWRPRGKWLAALEGRDASGGTNGSADAWTVRMGALHRTRFDLDATVRGTTYSGPFVEGDLYAADVSAQLGRVRLGARGGLRDETGPFVDASAGSVTWFGTDLDVLVGRRAYLAVSWDRTEGEDEANDQLFLSASWRF